MTETICAPPIVLWLRRAIFYGMQLPARLLAILIAISLIFGGSVTGASAANMAMDQAVTASTDMPPPNDCGDCGTEKAMSCSINIQCSLSTAIIPAQPALFAATPTFQYGKVGVAFVGRDTRPDPHPPKR